MARGLRDRYRFARYDTVSAKDGPTALAHIGNGDGFDLVLLDVMIPGLDGYEVCRRIRRFGSSVPIVMLTAKGRESDIVRGLDAGADDYVTKPFGSAELMARCRRLLRRQVSDGDRATTEADHRFVGMRLSVSERRLSRDGMTVDLTRREMDLLIHLSRRPGRVWTRHQLLTSVWGGTRLAGERSVDRCVTTLRRKLVGASGEDPIQTVRGIGYRFVDPVGSGEDSEIS